MCCEIKQRCFYQQQEAGVAVRQPLMIFMLGRVKENEADPLWRGTGDRGRRSEGVVVWGGAVSWVVLGGGVVGGVS